MTTGLSAGDGEDIELPNSAAAASPAGEAPAGWLGWARGLSTRPVRLPSPAGLWGGLGRQILAQTERAFLWTPVAFGIGAARYLGLKSEPPLWPAVFGAALAVSVAVALRAWGRARGLAVLAALAAVAACGFLAGEVRTATAAAPIVPPSLGVVPLEGFVVDFANPSDRGQRLLIAPVWVARIPQEQTPKRVRIVVPQGSVLGPGQAIRVTALLDPPPGPAAPGAYDFARDAWFEGLGGVGLAMEPPEAINLAPAPWRLRLGMAVNAMRWSLAQRLASDQRAIMGDHDGGAAGLAVTLGWMFADRARSHPDTAKAATGVGMAAAMFAMAESLRNPPRQS